MWDLVPRLSNANIVQRLWIFKYKKNYDRSFEWYKAHPVSNGANQQTRTDYGEAFNLVVNMSTIHMILSVALSKSWCLHQLDVKNAFLHGNLYETVYMHQPLGLHHTQLPGHVCLLKNYLHGLKQAPYSLKLFMTTLYLFINMEMISSIFFCMWMTLFLPLLLTLFVNLLCLSLTLNFPWRIEALPIIFLSQNKYEEEVIERTCMSASKPSLTLVDTKAKLSSSSGNPYQDPT